MTAACADSFDAAMVAALPALRRRCQSLAKRGVEATDLEQETIARALAARDRFEIGSNMAAWLCRIALNCYLSVLREKRVARVHLPIDDGALGASLAVQPSQIDRIRLRDVTRAIAGLHAAHRGVLFAVRLGGMSHADHAAHTGIAEGTSKSRLNRADRVLREAVMEGC